MNSTISRQLSLAVVSVLFIASHAWAEGKRSERLQAQAQKLAAIESQLRSDDLQSLDHHLAGIDRVLRNYQSVAALTCLSNGESESYERFKITDPATGIAIEKLTSLQTCRQLLTVQNEGLICVSNGERGSYEKFHLYNRDADKPLGGDTQLEACLTSIPY